MKRFILGFFALLLAMPLVGLSQENGSTLAKGEALEKAAAGVTLEVDHDYRWATHVTAAYGSEEYAQQRVESYAWKLAVDKAQRLGKEGNYADAIAVSPLSRQKAWATLNLLRKTMGGTLGENGSWTGYNVDKKGLFAGTPEEKATCVSLANTVKELVAAAQKAGMDKDMNGLDCADAALWADSYLNGILK